MSTKQLVEHNGRLISVSLSYEHPPIPWRGNDWAAWYTIDEDDTPDCGWGETADDAIEDLILQYDYEDKLPDFNYLYDLDLAYARWHWLAIERHYQVI